MSGRFHPAPLKEMARLQFREMEGYDREAYPEITDEHALIAYTDDETWIIEGDTLRVIQIDQKTMASSQQFYFLDAWGQPVDAL
jgi:hypothetical protein